MIIASEHVRPEVQSVASPHNAVQIKDDVVRLHELVNTAFNGLVMSDKTTKAPQR
jgi:hypothetical protein